MTVQINGDTGVSLVQDNTIQTADIVNGAVTPVKSSGFPFTMEYVSTQQSITNGSTITLPHGFGVIPKVAFWELVCTTAELGYSVGDVIKGASFVNNPGTGLAYGITVIANSTNLKIAVAAGGIIMMRLTDWALPTITNANWRLVVRAYA